jgi:hypothetical protein
MRQLHAARARQCDIQGIVTKDAACGNGHDGTPAMPPSQSSVPGGFAHLGRRIHVKRGDEIVFDRSAYVGLLGREVLKLDHRPLPPNSLRQMMDRCPEGTPHEARLTRGACFL